MENKIKEIEEKLLRKEQEYEDLRQYHNACCEEFEREKQALLEKYNQISTNFYSGYYCNTEHCSLLKAKEQECEELKNIIDKAKNSKLDLKSFLVGEAIQNEYEQQLNELRKERNKFKKQYRKNRLDRKKLEQKLERIREVLTNITEAGLCEAKEYGYDDNKECLECTLNEIKDVIQIIDEVDNEN